MKLELDIDAKEKAAYLAEINRVVEERRVSRLKCRSEMIKDITAAVNEAKNEAGRIKPSLWRRKGRFFVLFRIVCGGWRRP